MPLAGLSIHRIIREGIEISEELANFRYIRKKASKSTLIQLNFSCDFLPFSNFVIFTALYLREKATDPTCFRDPRTLV